MLRELKGAMNNDKPIGVLITLAQPTPGMKTQETAAGFYESAGKKYPRMQLLTVTEILRGKRPQMPPQRSPFAQAPREREQAKTERLL
jgi:site-specific DNA-methyltransferase (adenine-specific)